MVKKGAIKELSDDYVIDASGNPNTLAICVFETDMTREQVQQLVSDLVEWLADTAM